MSRYYIINPDTLMPGIRLSRIAQMFFIFFALSRTALADNNENVDFNSQFLRSDIDVSAFSQGNPVPQGKYSVDLYVNERWKGRTEVIFENKTPNATVAEPCFDLRLISLLGIDSNKVPEGIFQKLKDGQTCVRIVSIDKSLDARYDVGAQRLDIYAPQIWLQRHARGYVSPALWDNGIPAATLQYDYNAWKAETSGADNTSTQYLGLIGGINWDVWRLRYRGTFNWSNGQGWNYDNTSTYLERALVPLRSKLVIGESTTDGQVFDSVGFRGLMLTSDDRMFEDSQRGYAPIINGIANSNALVRVSQQGVRIYETTVPPGPFVIDDLYPTGTGGDLLVTIKEADGNERRFTVTYASIAELLRPGTTRYTLMGGRYHNGSVNEDPEIMMGTFRHGINNLVTGYTGVLGGQNYKSIAGGIALNTPAGAISTDITHARTTLRDNIKREGQSLRFSFAKILPVVGTNVTLASYRYSSSGYYDINDAMLLRAGQVWNNNRYSNSINRKNRLQLSASQSISDTLGSFNISASTQDYWNRSGRDTEYQLGYTNVFKRFNLNINASRTRDLVRDQWDNKIAIGISLPLGNSAQAMYLNSTYIQERDHHGVQNSIAGTAGEHRQFNYSAFANVDHYNDSSNRTTGGVNGNWTSPWTSMGGSFSAGNGYQQYGLNFSGGAIAYKDGVVLTPIMGDTMAVVEAKHAAGARLTNNNSISLDSGGKAAVPYLTPYRQNTIELDPKGLSNDVSLDITSQNSVPTAGAVVLLKYKTDIGHSVLFTVQSSRELPFGATLIDENNNIVGYIAQGGQSFARVKNEEGTLRVQWGDMRTKQCRFNYRLTSISTGDNSQLRQSSVVCQ
ncbi:fimbrial biogenesis outer membrane usher protein [Klebsiella oxytoca]|nr:fimbrial biogenesis outer membrane usher protein [Klebsiella oxytoca]